MKSTLALLLLAALALPAFAAEGKRATGNFHRNDCPANEGIVWENKLLVRSKPGKDTEQGNIVVALPLPAQK